MKCRILHESKGRMRIRALKYRMTMEQADRLQYYLQAVPMISKAKVNERTRDAVICYSGSRDELIRILSEFDFEETQVIVPDHTGRALQREYEDKLFFLIAKRLIRKFFFPLEIRRVFIAGRSFRFIRKGLHCLRRGRIEVPVLDAVTIGVSLLRGDYKTASSVMFLLKAGELLEEWTHRKSVDDLAQQMMLNVDKVWLVKDGTEVLVPVTDITEGDVVTVRTGNVIPLDGTVLSGEAEVNQASMTGESMPVHKRFGSTVFAGTVMEDGEIEFRVNKTYGSGRYDRIVSMIEESEKLKSATESRASHLADKLVPYSLGGTLVSWLLTRNVQRSLAFLMVDFSCALKLAMPISVLSAMRECGDHQITVKGGKFLEAVAGADTIVFDKTGTLTHAEPRVKKVVAFGDNDEAEMLRLAACLEEHFPHSIANAVVREAAKRGLEHEEKHAKVEYLVAHGIASTIEGKRVVLGSYHFIFEDEKCVLDEADKGRFRRLPGNCSLLYLALDGKLAAVICIEDPIREEAREVISGLHDLGFTRVVMMTGDSKKTARSVAKALGIDDWQAEVLPEDKAAFVRAEHEAGRKVVMIGDGINDSPALSEADAGIAISAGAAIAREVADITIAADDLRELLVLREISTALMKRIHSNYRKIMGFNGGLIGLGAAGVLAPASSALLHNVSTILFSVQSMKNLI